MAATIVIKGLGPKDLLKILDYLDREIRYEHFMGTVELTVKEA